MPAGLLRERIIFEQRRNVSDGAGNYKDDWLPTDPVAARIRFLKGTEPVVAQRLEGQQPVVITVRSSEFTRGVTADWRARNPRNGQTFNINVPTPGERRDYIDFLATAGGADG